MGSDIRGHLIVESVVSELIQDATSSRWQLSDDHREWLFVQTRGNFNRDNVKVTFEKKFKRNVSASTISFYKGLDSLNKVGNRGRVPMLSPSENELLLSAFLKLRETGTAVRASLVADAARGIKEKSTPGSTTIDGGRLKFSVSWAKEWMQQNGIRILHATTDRTSTPKQVVDSSVGFFSDLEKYKGQVSKPFTYNADEFFVCLSLSDNGSSQNIFFSQKWTWERIQKGENRTVAVRSDREGFTCTVLTNASGDVKLMQFIHKGTQKKFVNVGDDPRVLQSSRKETHFQSRETWKEIMDKFISILQDDR